MSRGLRAVAFVLALACGGCAVGRFVAGAPGARSASVSAADQSLLGRRCGGCHEIPNPAAMSDDAWRASLERMKRRMSLPASEWDSLAAMARND